AGARKRGSALCQNEALLDWTLRSEVQQRPLLQSHGRWPQAALATLSGFGLSEMYEDARRRGDCAQFDPSFKVRISGDIACTDDGVYLFRSSNFPVGIN